MSSGDVRLPESDLVHYHERGFLVVDALMGEEELAELRTIYDELFAKQVGRDVGDQYDLAGTDDDGQRARLPQLMNPAKYAPELAKMPFRRSALAIARQLPERRSKEREFPWLSLRRTLREQRQERT